METHGVGAAWANRKRIQKRNVENRGVGAGTHGVGAASAKQKAERTRKPKAGDANEQESVCESDCSQDFVEKQRAAWAKQKAERARNRREARSHKRLAVLGETNELETDGEGTASSISKKQPSNWKKQISNSKQRQKWANIFLGKDFDKEFGKLQFSEHSEGLVEKQRESDRSQGLVEKQHMSRSTTDIPEGGGGFVGMDIQVPDDSGGGGFGDMDIQLPDDSQARAKVKLTEEKVGEIPEDNPTREGEDWMETRKPNRKWKEKVKVIEEKLGEPKRKPKVEKLKYRDWCYMDDRDQILVRDLLDPKLKWEDKVMDILHMVRCRGFTEYNSKMQCDVPTRFCLYNTAFFDHDKESEDMPWPPIHQIPRPLCRWLYDSVNVIAIEVAQSDRRGPLSIYGTVLARDEYDFRCVYLFRRGRDDPQLITRKHRTLTLISPIRALAVRDSMFFEFHLKIKGGGDAADEDFSKGFIEHNAIRHKKQPTITSLESCLSTMELVYTPVRCALEASIAVKIVSILEGLSDFTSEVIAWTTGNDENKIVLYDSERAGSQTELGPGESVSGLVAVPLGEELVLYVSLADGVQHQPEECLTLVIGPDVDERTVEQGPYRMQVKISWKGVVNQPPGFKLWGRPNMWGYIAGHRVLLS